MKIKHLAVVGLLWVLSLSTALPADVVFLWGGARGTIMPTTNSSYFYRLRF